MNNLNYTMVDLKAHLTKVEDNVSSLTKQYMVDQVLQKRYNRTFEVVLENEVDVLRNVGEVMSAVSEKVLGSSLEDIAEFPINTIPQLNNLIVSVATKSDKCRLVSGLQ